MKQTKNKIIAALVICAISASFAACSKTDNSSVTTTIVNNDNQNASVTEMELPEKDAEGSQISVVQVTDAEGQTVTNAEGAAVTEPVILDNEGKIITDAKGAAVTPKLNNNQNTNNQNAVQTAASSDGAGTAAVTTTKNNNSSGENKPTPTGAVEEGGEGPAVYLYSKDGKSTLTAKPGDEIAVQIVSLKSKGYSSLISWVDIDTDIFEIVSTLPGDPDIAEYNKSSAKNGSTFRDFEKSKSTSDDYSGNPNNTENFKTIVNLFMEPTLENVTEQITLATLKLKVKDSVAAGEYSIEFDQIQDGKTNCNYIDENKTIFKVTPTFHNMKITIE